MIIGEHPMLFGVAYQGKYIVFRFIIEYGSLRDFGPSVMIIGLFLFLYEDFERWYFGWCWNLRLVLELYYILKDFGFF